MTIFLFFPDLHHVFYWGLIFEGEEESEYYQSLSLYWESDCPASLAQSLTHSWFDCSKNLTNCLHMFHRSCNTSSHGYDSCEDMCCGRGYSTISVEKVERCQCKYHWCCYVQCKICRRWVDTQECNWQAVENRWFIRFIREEERCISISDPDYFSWKSLRFLCKSRLSSSNIQIDKLMFFQYVRANSH
jgi:hypothetical protein